MIENINLNKISGKNSIFLGRYLKESEKIWQVN